MRSTATTVEEYLAALPADRRAALETLRKLILRHLPPGYEEAFEFGMPSYQVPLSVYPDTYNKRPLMYAALGSQKSHMAVYLCNVSGLPALRQKLEAGFKAAGKRLDMGSSCVRFKRLEELPLDVIADAVAATPMEAYVAFAKGMHSDEARAIRKRTRATSAKSGAAAKPAKAPAAKRRPKSG
jgi:hypothetical protein